MNPEHGNYGMPSGEMEYMPLSTIEAQLRRDRMKSKCRKIDYLFWAVLLGLLVVTILHFVVEPLITPIAHAEYSNKTEMCSHLTDPNLNGTEAKMELLKLCN